MICSRYAHVQHHCSHTSNFRNKFSNAFSLIEIILVIAIIGVLIIVSMNTMGEYATRQSFTKTVRDVQDGIAAARQNTIASSNDTVYGVHVSSTAAAFFEGTSFIQGDPNNTTIEFGTLVTATTSFTLGTQTITFDRLTGAPSATGTITLFDTIDMSVATITIEATGLIQ